MQWLLYQDNHRICRVLDLVWIGGGPALWSPSAPVREIMYEEQAAVEGLSQLVLDQTATYIVSSEALAQHHGFLAALAQVFEIERIVLTVRAPMLKELSEYSFSGWLRCGPGDWPLTGRRAHVEQLIKRLSAFAPLVLCPTEPERLGERFCRAIAGKPPDDVEQTLGKLGHANASVSPVLAKALFRALSARGIGPVAGPKRQSIVTGVREHQVAGWFHNELPEELRDLFNDKARMATELAEYEGLLRDFGVPSDIALEASKGTGASIRKLAQRTVPDSARQQQIDFYAERVISEILAQ